MADERQIEDTIVVRDLAPSPSWADPSPLGRVVRLVLWSDGSLTWVADNSE